MKTLCLMKRLFADQENLLKKIDVQNVWLNCAKDFFFQKCNSIMYVCMYERFRLSISSLRGALTQPITLRNLEPRSSDEVDT